MKLISLFFGKLDGQSNGSVLTVGPNCHVELEHLTIRNGEAQFGGGISSRAGADITLAEGGGGFGGSFVKASDCTFENNRAVAEDEPCGCCCCCGGAAGPGCTEGSGCGCCATEGGCAEGCGCCCGAGAGCPAGDGCGCCASEGGCAEGCGCGCCCEGDGCASGGGCDFDGGGEGGAIHNFAGRVEIVRCSFSDNTADTLGGAIFNEGELGDFDCPDGDPCPCPPGTVGCPTDVGFQVVGGELYITASHFSNNDALDGEGGAIFSELGDVTVTYSRMSHNSAAAGGAIHSTNGSCEIYNSRLRYNTAFDGGGGAIDNFADEFPATFRIIRSVLSHNMAVGPGGAIRNTIWNDGPTPCLFQVRYSTLRFNQGAIGGGLANFGGEVDFLGSLIYWNSAFDGPGGGIYNGSDDNAVPDPSGEVSLQFSRVFHNDPDDCNFFDGACSEVSVP